MKNERPGQTIAFETAEQQRQETPPGFRPERASRGEVIGETATEVARQGTREYSPSVHETVPETVSHSQMLGENRLRWNTPRPENPE